MLAVLTISALVKAEPSGKHHHPIGYSFAKFSGPVSGEINVELISEKELLIKHIRTDKASAFT